MRRAMALLLGSAALCGAMRAADEDKIVRTYYVDPSNADAVDDDDHGNEETPFKTIGRALQSAAADQDRAEGAKIVIADGVYHEALRVPPAKASAGDAPLVIEAANREQAIIDGAETAGWEEQSWKNEGATWSHPWLGEAPPPKEGKRAGGCKPLQSEALVFMEGQGLKQVAAPADLTPGSFCLIAPPPERHRKGTPTAPNLLVVQPPEGAGIAGVEVSSRPGGLSVEGRRNIIIRGITVQHALAPAALSIVNCSRALIDDVVCQWNNETGARIAGAAAPPWSDGITLRRVRLIHNGGSGLEASNVKNLSVEDSETSFNNFRGLWSDCIDPSGPAGSKATGIHGGAWLRHHAVGNSARGFWWASDCANIEIDDCVASTNLVSGMFFEDSAGPFAVRRCVVTGARTHPSARADASFPAGISICAASGLEIESSIVAGNEMPQLNVWDIAQRADSVNFETGARETHRAEHHQYRHNIFAGFNEEEPVFSLPTMDRGGKMSFDGFYATLDTDENCYWNPASTQAFCSFDKGYVQRAGVDLAAWQAFLASHASAGAAPDAKSVWADPRFLDPAEGDFQLGDGSPAADWGMPSDEGTPGG